MLVAARGSKNPDSGCLYINRHAHCVAHRIVLGKKHRVDPVTILRKRGRNGEGTTRSGSNSSLSMTHNLRRARIKMHLCANLSYLPLQISLGDAQFDPIHLHVRVSQANTLSTNMRIDALGRRRMCFSLCRCRCLSMVSGVWRPLPCVYGCVCGCCCGYNCGCGYGRVCVCVSCRTRALIIHAASKE